MKWIKRYNESRIIKVTDDNIKETIINEIKILGNECDLNHIDVSDVNNMDYLFCQHDRPVPEPITISYLLNLSTRDRKRPVIIKSLISKFNGDISKWNVQNVTNMESMFCASYFNGDISKWNVGNVTNMRNMFRLSPLNGDISKWNVENVIDMESMFNYSQFNGDISHWNVQNVQNMRYMFYYSQFNGDLTFWNLQNVTDIRNMFYSSPLHRKEPWWYVFSPLFGSTNLLWDSLYFKWIDLERKIIYRERLSKILLRTYNSKWDGKFPKVFGFTYQ